MGAGHVLQLPPPSSRASRGLNSSSHQPPYPRRERPMATTIPHRVPTLQHAIADLTGYEDADTLRWQPPCTSAQDRDPGSDGLARRGPAPTGSAARWPTSEAPASMNVKLKVGNMELMYTARDTIDQDLQDRMTRLLPWLTEVMVACEANAEARQQAAQQAAEPSTPTPAGAHRAHPGRA